LIGATLLAASFGASAQKTTLTVYTALETWSVVSNGGLRPVPNEIPLLAMVFCIQPLALRAN